MRRFFLFPLTVAALAGMAGYQAHIAEPVDSAGAQLLPHAIEVETLR
jgi:hypothetical protein